MFFNSEGTGRLFGLGFVVTKKIKHAVMHFEAITDKVCRIKMRCKFRKFNIIDVYAPTEEKELDVKGKFYELIEENTLNKVPKYDMKYCSAILMPEQVMKKYTAKLREA